ncbi:MAG: RnfABCDGE type electron transport complex subunit G [Lactobacillaceae bacterium]|nr:RnfABCDGE type electron transport complex subunit G [Lactobacillaceae bacterium]
MKNKQESPDFTSSIYFTIALFIIFIGVLLSLRYLLDENLKDKEYNNEYDIITSVIGTEFDNNPLEEKTIISSVDGKDKLELYPARQNGLVTSVVIKVGNERGYGGYMELVVGFFMDGTISRYRIITHNETLGLGSRITSKDFSEQFEWVNPERQVFKVAKDGGDIDAVASATVSSRAVIDSIRKAYDAYKKFIVGE